MLDVNARGVPRPILDVASSAPGADPRPTGLRLSAELQNTVDQAVTGLDVWLDSQRLPGGYGGPVVHWWRDSVEYTGPGLDWRYEGIITGYLNLWAVNRQEIWLQKAALAGDDLVHGQLPSGCYRNSCFEANPNTGGTPHEAAADLALLRLAAALKSSGATGWDQYLETAHRNLQAYSIDRLWDPAACSFRDDLSVPCFVPNKTATLCEALFAYARLTGDSDWIHQYALPSLDAVLAHQVTGGPLDGGIYQNSFGGRMVEKFFPYYIARCIPALLEGGQWGNTDRYQSAAYRAAEFVNRSALPDGSFPQVIYPGWRVNRYPQWIAGAGDVLRALLLARQMGFDFDPLLTLRWILAGSRADGGIRTALGFGRSTVGINREDPRDNISVVGWADKTFRVLTSLCSPNVQKEPEDA